MKGLEKTIGSQYSENNQNVELNSDSVQKGSFWDDFGPKNSQAPSDGGKLRGLVDPLTQVIPWEVLPKNRRFYTFGAEYLPYISIELKIRLLIEHKMALGGAGHCRKLTEPIFKALEASYGQGLSLWESSHSLSDLARVCSHYEHIGSTPFSLAHDVVLDQWLGHYRKYLDKQAKKVGRVAVNLANVPYMAGPLEIKSAIEALLGWVGVVVAIDPWWQKDQWAHDGTVTVYMPRVAAMDLIAKSSAGLLSICPSKTSRNQTPRKIKAWLAKSLPEKVNQHNSQISKTGSFSNSLPSDDPFTDVAVLSGSAELGESEDPVEPVETLGEGR